MTQHDIPAGKLASADCVVVIPGFNEGALVVGVGHGRGFISCRNSGNWSAPGAIALDSGSVGVQLGGEEMNIVILSMDKDMRSKLLSDRFFPFRGRRAFKRSRNTGSRTVSEGEGSGYIWKLYSVARFEEHDDESTSSWRRSR
jgi:hypothetical protein